MKGETNTMSELNGHTSAQETHNYNYSDQTKEDMKKSVQEMEREDIPGTPFQAIKKDGLWFMTWGQYLLTKPSETKEELLELLESDTWNIIGVFVISVMKQNAKIGKQLEEMAAKEPIDVVDGI